MFSPVRVSWPTWLGGAVLTLSACVATACGGVMKEDPAALDADADAAETARDTGRDALTDTFKEYVPKAPRCPTPDAGASEAATSDASDAIGEPKDSGPDGSDGAVPSPDASLSDAASDTASEGGESDAGPAVYPPVQVVSSGGRVLASPRVVPITYDGNPFRQDIEEYVASFGCTPYWHAVGSEYGVFEASGGEPIHLAEVPPSSVTERAIEKWLRSNLDGKTPGWELPRRDSIYAIYYPSTTSVTLSDLRSCEGFDGFHSSVTLKDGTSVAYAVMVDCGDNLDELTSVSSHEFIEASTDPDPLTKPAYQRTDNDHLVYGLNAGGEVGDLCTMHGGSFFPDDYPFMVQRSWSNASARAGHDPCVPASSDPYFNTVPELPDTVAVNFSFSDTKGVRIPVGGERTIHLQLFSDAPTEEWNLSARDTSGESPHLSFSFDKKTGKSGDRIALTISKKNESSRIGAEPFAIISSNSKRRNVSYGVVGH